MGVPSKAAGRSCKGMHSLSPMVAFPKYYEQKHCSTELNIIRKERQASPTYTETETEVMHIILNDGR